MNKYDVIILGGGPAGLSTALYTARANLKTLIIDTGMVGGKLNFYETIENLPSFTDNNSATLISQLSQQVDNLGVEVMEFADIENVDLLNKVITVNGKTIEANNIVIATGSQPKTLGIKGEKEFTGKGVSYCATCDGPLYKDKLVAVIGGGNTALEEAIYLTKFASKVYILHRREEFRADRITIDEALKNDKIEFIVNVKPIEIQGESKVTQVILDYNGINRTLFVDGIFPFIGIIPNSELFKEVEKNASGFIITDAHMQTSISGVYAVGDVRNTNLRQVVTACSDGAIAGHFISKEK